MKILITYYIPSGGVETLNRQRYAALSAHGVECHFLYQWPSEDGGTPPGGMIRYITDEDEQLRQLLAAHAYDAVIVNANYLMLERIRRCGFQGPLIFECQGLGTIEQTMGTLLEALPFIHSCCNAVLYPRTRHMQQLFQDLYPNLLHYSFHNCLDTKEFTYRSLPRLSEPVIAWVGRIEKNKNWSAFLRMAQVWLKQHPAVKIWMFEHAQLYEEDERARFEKAVTSYPFNTDRFVRLTNVPHAEMAERFSQIGDSGGFLCSTSLNEGFGYALLEAMSCRCPVLASDSDGPASFIIHDRTGKLYPSGDEQSGIREGLEYLRKPNKRNKIRLQGQRYVEKHFSPEVYARHFVHMLRQLGAAN